MYYYMYEKLNYEKRKWSTSLLYCDPESCILSHYLPCHIYAKLNKDCYLFNFLYYGIFCVSIYNVYYWLDYINNNRCPSLETAHCFGLGDNCSQHYMVINGIPAKCIFDEICIHSEISCFQNFKELNIFLYLLGSISYFVLFILHLFLREKIKKEYDIEGQYDACALTLCSPCGLAQEYREIENINV